MQQNEANQRSSTMSKQTKAVSSTEAVSAASSTTAVPTTVASTGVGSSVGSGNATTTTGPAPTRPLTGLRLDLQEMLTGMQAVIPDGATLPMPGGAMAKSAIVGALTTGLSLYTAVDTQETVLETARQQLTVATPGLKTLFAELKAALIATLGKTSPLLKQLRLVIKQRTPLTPEQQVARTARMNQTRAIRGTTSKKQKAKLQYTGTVVVSTQVNAPAVAEPTEAPSGSAAAAGTGGAAEGASGSSGLPPGSKAS
jgi:hypothetical protein